MKRLYISMFVLSGLLLSGCSDDFLDVEPTEAIPADPALVNSDAGASGFVTAIYNQFLGWEMSSFGWNAVSSIITDDADKGSDPGDAGGDKDIIDALTYNASTPSFQSTWEANYAGINRCNQALAMFPKLDQATPGLKARLVGETKFMRAFMYFTLVKGYGGVPIIDHLATVPISEEDRKMQLTRKSVAEVYAFIEQDLNDAIEALPLKSAYTGADVVRVSKGSAYALLAKVNLYQKNWQKVIDNCDNVTGYSLVSDYAAQFKKEGEFGPESIFEINGVGSTSTPGFGIGNYSVSQAPRGAGGWGWGFNTPTEGLANAYEAGDVRRAATIIFRGSVLYDGRVIPSTVANPRYNYKAYSSSFYNQEFTDTNLRYLRYAEVLLMKAEALNELGQTSAAIPLVNMIRKRAGLGDTPFVSQADIRKAIWKERRLELAFEHDRWFDLVRTGQAAAAMAADGKTFVVGKHELWPIPTSFLREAGGLSQQNPGGY
ncbi:Starch-binding associating with outer membrane [Flavobacterium aquidurense]|uniref:RagB/SusD family nutrient uptake outer membrane protein n=1 Tax=Flavobacterium frigidimaris TaxID=262320 RepID=A0ABX4BKC3_FLAFR|nr:RagB/SusD family nutrient uptake outer membrane protein [Flavobacterium frigidimaris]OXA75410.1 RagB/SusD family nutrient uptake outer membrane protein [Flavobacterium frigidimaris]SDY39880.1 Starch-binding associating with outer membrane [Flavobacterium aquidurense]